ncbi:MAG: hypothetical protein ABJC89_19880 [Acidobacteriota bacterium]
MNRIRFALAAVALASFVIAPVASAQSKTPASKPAPAAAPGAKAAPAAPAQAPATPAKWVKPIKGTASIEVIQGVPKKIGSDMVTVLKVRNMSAGSIGLLKVDEYWYNKKQAVISGDTERYPKPFNPGDVIELTMRSPIKPDLFQSQYAFSHAGGDIKAKPVKKFE